MGLVTAALGRRADSRASVGASYHPSRLDDPGYVFGTGFGDDATGLNLSEREVLGWPAVLQALRMISWSVAMMPCHLYRKEGDGAKKLRAATEHPLHWVLHDEPHPEYTPFEWKAANVFNALFRGNGYCQILRSRGEVVERLFPLDTHRMVDVTRRAGRLRYHYNQANGRKRVFRDDEILHIRGFGDGGVLGLAMAQLSPTTLAKGVAMDRFGGRVFKNGVSGNAVAESEHDAQIKWKTDADKKAFFDKLSDSISGEKNWHKVIGLPPGMKLRTLGITAKEAQLVEGLTFQVQDVARLTGVPPSLLMDLSRATFTNSEQQMLQFVQLTLGPWIVNIEERLKKSLLTPQERREYTIKFLVDALLRTDLKTQNDALRVAVGQPWMSVNEARDLKELAPIEGKDSIAEPQNMFNPGGNPKTTDGGGTAPKQDGDSDTRSSSACSRGDCTHTHSLSKRESDASGRSNFLSAERRAEVRDATRERRAIRAAFRRSLKRDGQRLIRGVIREVKGLAAKHLDTRAASDFASGVETYFERGGFSSAVSKILGPIFESYAESVIEAAAREQDVDAPDLGDFVTNYVQSFVEHRGGKLYGQIKKLVEETDADALAEAIEKRLKEWEAGREDGERMSQAEKIAQQEAVRMGDMVARATFAAVGVTRLAWISNAGACPICEELDGQIIGIDDVFVKANATIDPGAEGVIPLKTHSNVNQPPLHGGCECMLAAG